MEPMVEVSREGKHDLHNKDTLLEGPSKRTKLSRYSEPPISSSTTSHNQLQEIDKTLECETTMTNQALRDSELSPQTNINKHADEVKRIQHLYDGKAEELRMQTSIMKTEGAKYHRLKQAMEDPVTGLQALQNSCQKKDEESTRKDEVIAAKQKELDDSNRRAEASEKELNETRPSLKSFKRKYLESQNELALRDEKLASKDRELGEAIMGREESEKVAEAACIINDRNGSRNESLLKKEETAKKKLKKARNEYNGHLSNLQAEKSGLQERLADLRTYLKTRENDHNAMVAALQLENRKLRGPNHRYNHKEPDEKIKEDFVRLNSRIQQFVDRIARPVLSATDEELKSAWTSWSPELREWLRHPLLCSQVLEAYVWECLMKRIFIPGSKVWAGEMGQSFEGAFCMAADKVANSGFENELYIDYQYLRSSTSSLIKRLGGGDFLAEHFDSNVKNMTSTLAKLCGLSKITDEMETNAMGIFKDARDFEIQLRMLKAKYDLVMDQPVSGGERLKYGFTLADEIMNARYPSPRAKALKQTLTVDFIISPSLYKRGNNSGADYEVLTCLVKMDVLCDAATLFLSTGKSIDAQASSESSHKFLASTGVKQDDAASTSRRHEGSAVNKGTRDEVVILDPETVKTEDRASRDGPDPLSMTDHVSGPPVTRSHDAAQTQSNKTTGVMTRSKASTAADKSIHTGTASAKSPRPNHFPTGTATGRGGGAAGKKVKFSNAPWEGPE